MKTALRGRALRTTLILATATGTAALTAVGVAANAATHHPSSHAPKACNAKIHGSARSGHFGGIVRPVALVSHCQVHITSDAANGTPPLIWHKGPVMGTPSTGPVVVTPIFWNPPGHPMSAAYKGLLTTYLAEVAGASGKHTNVYSTLNEYFGSNGPISYQIQLGTPVNDTNPLPASSCKLNGQDRTRIYADGTGYNACIDDNQVIAETENVVNADGLTTDLGHIYVLYLPKGVESCFFGGSTTTANNACTINHQPSAAYCAYHSMAPSGMVYANMPYPIYASPVGFTCSSDARFPDVQTPNGNADGDTEVSPTSHEIMESITDPDTNTGWYDSSGFENGDECAYVFGSVQGQPGGFYNQVIGGHHYLTQEEFSNRDFAVTGKGCLQSE
jgi:hypothetical protein